MLQTYVIASERSVPNRSYYKSSTVHLHCQLNQVWNPLEDYKEALLKVHVCSLGELAKGKMPILNVQNTIPIGWQCR